MVSFNLGNSPFVVREPRLRVVAEALRSGGGDTEIHTQSCSAAKPKHSPRACPAAGAGSQEPPGLGCPVCREFTPVTILRFGWKPWAAGGLALWLAHCPGQVHVKNNVLLVVGAAPAAFRWAGESRSRQVHLCPAMMLSLFCFCIFADLRPSGQPQALTLCPSSRKSSHIPLQACRPAF